MSVQTVILTDQEPRTHIGTTQNVFCTKLKSSTSMCLGFILSLGCFGTKILSGWLLPAESWSQTVVTIYTVQTLTLLCESGSEKLGE